MTTSTLASDHIATLDLCAARSAATLLAQGWDGEPNAYDLGNFHGDLEAAEEQCGELSREDRLALEGRIRHHLEAAS